DKVAATPMGADEKFAAIRKGLLEFLILKIVSADKVYVADMLERLARTDFATQEGTLYPLLSRMRRDGLLDYEWQGSDAGPPRKYHRLAAPARVRARRRATPRSSPISIAPAPRWPAIPIAPRSLPISSRRLPRGATG